MGTFFCCWVYNVFMCIGACVPSFRMTAPANMGKSPQFVTYNELLGEALTSNTASNVPCKFQSCTFNEHFRKADCKFKLFAWNILALFGIFQYSPDSWTSSISTVLSWSSPPSLSIQRLTPTICSIGKVWIYAKTGKTGSKSRCVIRKDRLNKERCTCTQSDVMVYFIHYYLPWFDVLWFHASVQVKSLPMGLRGGFQTTPKDNYFYNLWVTMVSHKVRWCFSIDIVFLNRTIAVRKDQ